MPPWMNTPKNPNAYNDVVRVRVPAELHAQLRATGVPVSAVIRAAIVSYLAEPAHPDLTRLVEKDF